MFHPSDADELAEVIVDARAVGRKLEIRGGGSKAGIRVPGDATDVLDMRAFSGVVDYDPAELVLTVAAATSLAEIETLVAANGQMLAFEPFDYGPWFAATASRGTIGGVMAAGVSGSRRLSAGAARDHLLGFAGVSGRGERFVAGGKVVKNVTGFDLSKLVCGSWGRLVALTEVTLKVMPKPRSSTTRVYHGMDVAEACGMMRAALASKAGVSAAAHVPGGLTALRLEGFAPSVEARLGLLAPGEDAGEQEASTFWENFKTMATLDGDRPLWRISVPPRGCAPLVEALQGDTSRFLVDWGGALVWATLDAKPLQVREAAASFGGHAMLVRRGASSGDAPVFSSLSPAIEALEARIRRAFDPDGVFETGRFGDSPRAD